MTKRLAMAALGLAAAVTTMAAGQGTGLEPLLAELRNPSARARVKALERLGELGRPDAAAPMAAMLADGHDGVQSAAVNALLSLYTVRADLRQRPWGPGSVGKSATASEVAFEAGPLATMPAEVPAEVLTGLSAVVRQGQSVKTRLEAAYALGTLGSPAMGPMGDVTANAVAADLAATLLDPDRPTRQVVARIAGRVFAPPGRTVPASLGDALVNSMNDGDPLVRRWAMDSLGWLRYDRAMQALTDRASYHGKSEEGSAALHGLARIASPASAPVFRALLASSAPTFRVISIEGLGRIGERSVYPAIAESALDAKQVNVTLAAHLAAFLLAQTTDLMPLVMALRNEDTAIQARVYLAEVAERQPLALHELLRSPDPWVRRGTAELLGTSRRPTEEPMLQPLLKDPAPEVIETASEAIRRLRAYAAVAPQP
ncbi:MAG: HEAT repeat domain-containing protein [Vicinamibacteria bacterium]|nr:HEAT repeat domain-containing protein [Vicinamibacteria bacterium]